MAPVISVEQHRRRILATVGVGPVVDVPVTAAHGCVLARDVAALVPLPGFDNSAMDGYVVRSADVAGLPVAAGLHLDDGGRAADPLRLPVLGDIAAGERRRLQLEPGHAFRIMTGAPLPVDGDLVVPVELTDGGEQLVTLYASQDPGRHIRRAGEDVRPGDVVLRAGTRLGARQLAIAAAVGLATVPVHRRPRVVCLSTGDELVPPGTVPGFGQVVDSNGLMLAAALQEAGFEARAGAVVRDTPQAVLGALREHVEEADAIVTTGGVSMGAYDAVKAALSSLGTVQFDRVAMQPGKPQGFGTLGARQVPLFALPGNPVSALVSLEVFVVPALRQLAGGGAAEVAARRARVVDGWSSPGGRTQFVRVLLDDDGGAPTIRSAGGQGSHVLQALADADALAVVPADVTRVEPGDVLDYRPLAGQGWPGER